MYIYIYVGLHNLYMYHNIFLFKKTVTYFVLPPTHLQAFQRTPDVAWVSPCQVHIMSIEKLNRGCLRDIRKTRVVL
jgi:hypothetical protein